MTMSTNGTIASAPSRLEKPSGAPFRLQCVATVGGSWGYAQTDIATANAAITRPNQRLRMLVSPPPETGHEKPHDFLKHGGIKPKPDELAFPLLGDGIPPLGTPEGGRHRPERNR